MTEGEQKIESEAVDVEEGVISDLDQKQDQDFDLDMEPQVEQEYDSFAVDGEPAIIPHQEGVSQDDQMPAKDGTWRTPAIIASLVLLIICCCLSFFLFLYYYGGDWMLRQMGLLP